VRERLRNFERQRAERRFKDVVKEMVYALSTLPTYEVKGGCHCCLKVERRYLALAWKPHPYLIQGSQSDHEVKPMRRAHIIIIR
jgi:hypothetical protein